MRAHRLADPDLILSCLRIVAASLIVLVVKVCGCVICVFVDTGEERRETRDEDLRAPRRSLCTNKSSSESLATPHPTSPSPTVTSVSGPVAFGIAGSVLLHRARATSVICSVEMTLQ